MTILEIKQYLKANKMTYKDLADKCNVPESTLKNLFSGATKNPRIDTMQAIERALEIDEEKPTMSPKKAATPAATPAPADEYSDEEKRLVGAYRVLPEGKRLFLLEMIEKFAAEEKGERGGNKWNRA